METILRNKLEQKLCELKESLMRTLLDESETFQAMIENLDPTDLADIAADDIDRSTLEALSAQDAKKLRLIESALSRMRNNHYGNCMRCGKKIPEERLNAIPYALMCIECKSSDERKNR